MRTYALLLVPVLAACGSEPRRQPPPDMMNNNGSRDATPFIPRFDATAGMDATPAPDALVGMDAVVGQDALTFEDASVGQDALTMQDALPNPDAVVVGQDAVTPADGGVGADAEGMDAQTPMDAAGPADAIVNADATVLDSGVIADSGTPPPFDAGLPPGPCPNNFNGCRCTPPAGGAPGQGSCVDTAALCTTLDPTLSVCHRQCVTDQDCAGVLIGNPVEQRRAPLCRQGLCVELQQADDDACSLHAIAGRSMAGCRPAAQCLIFANDPPGEGRCAQTCVPTPQDPNGGCLPPVGFCNPGVLMGAMGPLGVCTDAQRGVGARCGNALGQRCDTTAGQNFCFTNSILDPMGTNPLFPSLGLEEGFCVEGCDPLAPACPNTSDPGTGVGQCVNLGTGMTGPVGLCSHECSEPDDLALLPNTCRGPGSLGVGRNCFAFPGLTVNQMQGIFGQIDVCLDVLTPTVAEAAITNMNQTPRPTPGTTPPDCLGTGQDGELFRCETGTQCLNVGEAPNVVPGCVRLCTATSTTAVPPFAVAECAQTTATPNAVCIPFAATATTPPAVALGFCGAP